MCGHCSGKFPLQKGQQKTPKRSRGVQAGPCLCSRVAVSHRLAFSCPNLRGRETDHRRRLRGERRRRLIRINCYHSFEAIIICQSVRGSSGRRGHVLSLHPSPAFVPAGPRLDPGEARMGRSIGEVMIRARRAIYLVSSSSRRLGRDAGRYGHRFWPSRAETSARSRW